jgi:hypothetical protein
VYLNGDARKETVNCTRSRVLCEQPNYADGFWPIGLTASGPEPATSCDEKENYWFFVSICF